MLKKIQGIQELLTNKSNINLTKKLRKITRNYIFLLVSANLNFYQNEQIYENIRKARVIIIDHYEEAQNLYFILSFHKTILLINQSQINFLHPLLSLTSKLKLLFLTKKKDIFDQLIKIEYKEQTKDDQSQLDEEISNLCKEFYIPKSYVTNFKDLWDKFSKCMSAYMIQNSYNLLTKNRIKKFFSKKRKIQKTKIFYENDYVELRIIGAGSLFITVLIYHIVKGKLYVIKKVNSDDKEIPKLLKREVDNYTKISHQFLPKFYGTVEGENFLVIEYIYGRTLMDIEYLHHLSEKDKFVIIFELISVFDYLHKNHFIYRDLKPDNVMIDQNKTLVLIDFDRLIMDNYTPTTIDFNSPFVSPEVNSCNVTFKSDYYSIGLLIFYILSETIPRIYNVPNLENYGDYSSIQQLCEKCIKKKPDDRTSDLYSDLINCMLNNKIDEVIHYYSLAADQNDIDAQYFLGLIYNESKYIRLNINKAIYYFTLAAEKNNVKAQFNLGLIYYKDQHIARNISKSIHYFTLAANQNDSDAQFYLGLIYYKGEGIVRDINKAIHFYSLSADNNNIKAQYNLGLIYYKDKHITQDINKSVHYFNLAAAQNDANAQFYLGLIYYKGEGIVRDINKAIHYFTLSADQNDAYSQLYLGLIYLSMSESSRGINYLIKSATKNNRDAQYLLGQYYIKQFNDNKNISKGIDFLIQSANNGHIESSFVVGYLYHKGESKCLQQNISESIHFYKEASSFNNQYAKNNLGIIYKNGFKDKILKRLDFSTEYFKEAIRQKNDKVAMYNISHIYIYEENDDKLINFSIDLLMKSSNLRFEPSTKMLCLVLVKKYGTKIDLIEEKIKKYTDKHKYFITKFKKIIEQNNLNDQTFFNKIYEYQKTVDYLYNFLHEPIEYNKLFESVNKEEQQNIPRGEDITKSFYEGFEIDSHI